jgi:hypothetical protein
VQVLDEPVRETDLFHGMPPRRWRRLA